MNIPRLENLGPNHQILFTEKGSVLVSYGVNIAFIPEKPGSGVQLDSTYWNYSKTTDKHRNLFLGETLRETQARLKTGEYELTDLN